MSSLSLIRKERRLFGGDGPGERKRRDQELAISERLKHTHTQLEAWEAAPRSGPFGRGGEEVGHGSGGWVWTRSQAPPCREGKAWCALNCPAGWPEWGGLQGSW